MSHNPAFKYIHFWKSVFVSWHLLYLAQEKLEVVNEKSHEVCLGYLFFFSIRDESLG